MKKYTSIIVVVFVLVVGIVGYKLYSKPKPVFQDPTVVLPYINYTMADIQAHATASDCWTAVNGRVYNLTAFIPSHPGGRAIIKACGKDGTALFMSEDEHAEQNAQATLDAFVIGVLKK